MEQITKKDIFETLEEFCREKQSLLDGKSVDAYTFSVEALDCAATNIHARYTQPGKGVEEATERYAKDIYKEYAGKGYPKIDLLVLQKIADCERDFLSGASFNQDQCGWISCEDGLPANGPVLGCMKDTLSIYVCYYKNTVGFQVWGLGREQPILDMKVTHWMPLPQPPKQVC